MTEFTIAEQIRWQRQSAALLTALLELAAKRKLPPITWTVQSAGASLAGQCAAHPGSVRRGHFQVWLTAITEASGRSPDHRSEHTFAGGEMRLSAGWERMPIDLGRHPERLYPSVHIALVASIWPEEEPDE